MTHQRNPNTLRDRQGTDQSRAVAQSLSHDPNAAIRLRFLNMMLAATLGLAVLLAAHPSFARGAPESFADLAEKLLPAVVNISSEQEVKRDGPFPEQFMERFGRGGENQSPRKAQSLGSGFVIDGTKGIVITNNHVIEGADSVKVILQDDEEYVAEIVGSDPSTDVAVLKIELDGKTLPEVPWGDSDTMRVGDWVVAIGNPLGLGGTVTAGIISARGRNIQSGPYDDYIQTDASINRGNSGGPLFNMDGQVIGINTAIFSQTGGSIGIGFSIPSNQAMNVADQILKYGSTRRGWLGVSIQEVTKDIADSLNLEEPHGALISTVHDGGPALAAGFKAGDVVVTFGGKKVDDTRELLRLVANAPVDEEVDVEVWRDGKTITLSPVLGQREKIDLAALSDNGAPESGAGTISKLDSLGLEIAGLTDEIAQEYGIQSSEGGVVIAGVASGSDAEEKDLRVGDVVLEVNQNAVSTPKDVETEVQSALDSGRSSVLLKVLRGDRKIFVAVRFAR
ncbi:MAG TPA: serine protease [Rhodospirillaceae bacterium]|nr:serine protease [Rhodospirillaceae bacterium]MBB56670.1 serine protease [Rhodospirillaceae bacterium]HAJ21337.1 serine protease [Rhodospirillaceae bacterium]HBM12083.1 serine protease [Rhodospirillaceae bacterium]|tara:strand:+ start:5241 stop:6764 length:1524 start_codon:yes stop_codon:yes gene_type:complete